jgi:soluble lytic murein transglycosylase
MKQKIVFFVMMITITSLSCDMQRVFNPSLPTNTPDQPTEIPLPLPTPTMTPIPTPEPGARIENGDQAYFNGDWDKAISEYSQALNNSTDSDIQVAALLGLGRSLNKSGDPELAKGSLLTAIDTYPQSSLIPVIYFTLGEVYESQGLYVEAANAFQEYYKLRPGLIDFYIQERIGDMWFAAKEFNNAIAAYQSALQAPYIGDTLYLDVKIGDAYEALGDIATSLIIYEDVFNRTSDNREKALMKYYIGWAQITLGQTDQGYASYMEAVTQYPQYYGAYLALLKLIEAEKNVDWYTKGLVYYTGEQYGLAVDAFVRYLKEYPDTHASAAHYYLGIAYQHLGNYEEAINQWQMLIDTHYKEQFWAESFEKIADTYYIDLRKSDASIQTYLDFLEVAPDFPEAPEYLYYAGRIAERSGDLQQAASLWERIGIDYSTSDKAYEGLFQAGIVLYRMGKFDDAVAQFSSTLGVAGTSGEQAGAQFWIGKCYNELEEFQAAHSAWLQASTIDPTGYYSARALEILNDQKPFTPPINYSFTVNNLETKTEADAWMHQTFNIPPEEDLNDYSLLLNDPRFIRGTELWNLGLYDKAKEEFSSFRLDIKINPANSYRLASYLIDMGLYYTGIQAARDVLDSAGYDPAGTLSAPVYFNYIRFGTYYSDVVLPVTQEFDYDPLLFYSIMRRESLFESFITSSAGAGGLMQIWPPTGEAVHNQTNWPPDYTEEDLYRPLVSVKYGAYILDELRRRFNDNWYAILAGYHAGPDNASIWLSLAPDDPDLFVEVIRFSDTRDYIRWVYELHVIYKNLYEVN